MQKSLGQCFGGAVIVCGTLLALASSAHAQSVSLFIYADTVPVQARQMSAPQLIHIVNQGAAEATGLSVTFRAPKGAKVDTTCQEDHLPGGVRSYTCLVGSLGAGQNTDVTFSISMNKSGTADIRVDATCDQESSGALLSIPIL